MHAQRHRGQTESLRRTACCRIDATARDLALHKDRRKMRKRLRRQVASRHVEAELSRARERNSELEQELERMAIELDAKDRQLESAPKASRSASA
jgi:hypothetical protein